jgi:YD repeat-containing protein
MAGRFPVDWAAPREAGRGLDDTIGALKGRGCDEEADAGRGVPGLGLPGVQAGDGGGPQAPGEPSDRWSWGARSLGPDGPRLPSGPGVAAAVHAGILDDLTAAPVTGPVPDLVDAATGDVLLVQDDVSLPAGAGVLPLAIGRVYRSSWRSGRWFGASWASTFDQRLNLGPERVTGVFADGRILSWPCRADADGRPVPVTGLPVTGPRWRLERAGEAYTVTDPQAGVVWRFEPRPGYGGPHETWELPLVLVSDRGQHQVSLSYTPAGQPAWITHSAGYRVRVVMNGARIAGLRLVDPAADAPLAGYRYDPAGNLAGIVGASGQTLRICHDEEGRLTGVRDRTGRWCRYTYDEQGRCVACAGPDGAASARFAYGDRVTWRTDAAGAVTIYQLDGSSRVTAVTDPLGHVTHLWYDEYGRVTARADPLGRLTRYGYDERGNLICVTHPDGSQQRAVYDDANLPVELEDPDGARWQQEYDAHGNLVRQVAPDQAVTSYRYDDRGHLARVTGPLGATTSVECDPAGLPVTVTAPDGAQTRYERDARGRVTAVCGPDAAVTALSWTADGQLAARVFPDGTSERRDYDAEGNLTGYLSPVGEQTRYSCGPFGRVTAVTGPDGIRAELSYDHALRLIAVTRAGLTWRYTYDAAGRMVAAADGDGATVRYAYDAAGQLTGRVNAEGQEVSWAYDDLGRPIRRVADGVASTFSYDAAGRLVRAGHPDAEIRLSRDPVGRVTAETCNDRTVLSSWDRAGRRSRRVTPGGAQRRWEYDDAGHPVLLDAGGQVLRFAYDQAGREIRRDLPGGLALSQDWDAAGRLACQVLESGGRVLARRGYRYRPGGDLDRIDDLLAGARRYTRDGAGRIVAVDGDGWAERYGYDPDGRVASARWSAPPPSAAGLWLDAGVQGPRERTGTLVTKAGTVRYRHDRQGRVTGRQRDRASGEPAVWAYRWDAGDRLTSVTAPDGSTWRYRYDPLGRRIGKQRVEPSGTLAEETTFTWDGTVLAEEATRLPGPAGWRRVTWDYQPGTGVPVTQAERVSRDDTPPRPGDERFYAIITDQDGTPAELARADGTMAGYQQHTLSGGTLWHPDGAATPLRSGGQYHDPETGLHYHRRFYDPVICGYLTPGPLDPDSLAPGPLAADPLNLLAGARAKQPPGRNIGMTAGIFGGRAGTESSA